MLSRGRRRSVDILEWPLPGLFGRHEAAAWALIGLVLALSAALAQVVIAGPGLMASCDEIPPGAPHQRCSIVDASMPYEGTVAAAFVAQHVVMVVGASLATFGAFTLRVLPGLAGILLTYLSLLPLPVDAALRGWSAAAAEDLGDFSAVWGYLALGAWAWPLRGRFADRPRGVLVGLLAFLFVGGPGALWIALTAPRDVEWNLFAIAFGLVHLATGAWLLRAVLTRPEEAVAPPLRRAAALAASPETER